MTRLVVLSVAATAGWAGVQRQLVAWREPLERAGVRLDPSDVPDGWATKTATLVTAAPAEAVTQLARRAVADGVDMLLLGSSRLQDSWSDPDAVASLLHTATELTMQPTVLSVIRDQLGVLNALYSERVMGLHMARDFAAFAANPNPVARFDYGAAYAALVAAADADFVAVPYSSPANGQVRSILDALAVEVDGLSAPVASLDEDALPGPVVIAATRLLFKRMWRLGIFNGSLSRKTKVSTLQRLRAHARERSWDETTYCGWSAGLRADAIATYQAGNDALAHAVWDRAWGDAWESAPYTEVDLASQSPTVVVDVLVTVDRLVRELQDAKVAAVEG